MSFEIGEQKKGSDSEVVLSWELLREMCGEENVANGVFLNPNGTAAAANAPNALPERVFARDYARNSLSLKNRLSAGQATAHCILIRSWFCDAL